MSDARPVRLLDQVAREVEMVVSSLSPLAGERTIWLDPYGRLWHGAPGQGLPHDRWRTVGTFRRPSLDVVSTAVLDVLRGVQHARTPPPTAAHGPGSRSQGPRPASGPSRPDLRAP